MSLVEDGFWDEGQAVVVSQSHVHTVHISVPVLRLVHVEIIEVEADVEDSFRDLEVQLFEVEGPCVLVSVLPGGGVLQDLRVEPVLELVAAI